jgi:hypothetical protein
MKITSNIGKIGLYFGFEVASQNQNVLPTISEQFRNQILSGWRYNGSFLKGLLKKILFLFEFSKLRN